MAYDNPPSVEREIEEIKFYFSRYANNLNGSLGISEPGIRIVKRKLLGLCGRSAIKSLEEITKVFLDTKIAKTPDEARELISRLDKLASIDDEAIVYASYNMGDEERLHYIYFRKIIDRTDDYIVAVGNRKHYPWLGKPPYDF